MGGTGRPRSTWPSGRLARRPRRTLSTAEAFVHPPSPPLRKGGKRELSPRWFNSLLSSQSWLRPPSPTPPTELEPAVVEYQAVLTASRASQPGRQREDGSHRRGQALPSISSTLPVGLHDRRAPALRAPREVARARAGWQRRRSTTPCCAAIRSLIEMVRAELLDLPLHRPTGSRAGGSPTRPAREEPEESAALPRNVPARPIPGRR